MPQAARELDSSSKTPEAAGPGLASGPAQVGRARAGAAPGKRPRRPACPPARPPRLRRQRRARGGAVVAATFALRAGADPPGACVEAEGCPTDRGRLRGPERQPHARPPRSQTALGFPPFVTVPGHTRPASPAGLRRAPRANSRAASPPPPGARPARPGGGGGWRAAPGPRRPDGAPVGGRRAPGASLRRCAEPPRRSGLPTPGPRRRSRLGRRARGSRGRSAARPRLP